MKDPFNKAASRVSQPAESQSSDWPLPPRHTRADGSTFRSFESKPMNEEVTFTPVGRARITEYGANGPVVNRGYATHLSALARTCGKDNAVIHSSDGRRPLTVSAHKLPLLDSMLRQNNWDRSLEDVQVVLLDADETRKFIKHSLTEEPKNLFRELNVGVANLDVENLAQQTRDSMPGHLPMFETLLVLEKGRPDLLDPTRFSHRKQECQAHVASVLADHPEMEASLTTWLAAVENRPSIASHSHEAPELDAISPAKLRAESPRVAGPSAEQSSITPID